MTVHATDILDIPNQCITVKDHGGNIVQHTRKPVSTLYRHQTVHDKRKVFHTIYGVY